MIKSKRQNTCKEPKYWIALNGASCALHPLPMAAYTFTVVPRPEQLLGFATLEEAKEMQQVCLKAPISQIAAKMLSLSPRVKIGEIVVINLGTPEPPTYGPTIWISGEV